MAHLGYLLTALADGQLSPATTEKVLEHVAVCRPCAAELAAEREARRILAEAECESVGADLAARLRTICDEPLPVDRARPHRSRHAAAWVGLGSVVGASALAACLFVAGSPREAGPLFTDSGALTTLGAVAEAPGTALAVPAALGGSTIADDGVFTVTAHRTVAEGRGSVVELAGQGGHVVLVVQPGRLDPASVAHLDPVEVLGGPRYVLATEPWHAVWQSGEDVVEIVTDLPSHRVAELVGHFPADDYDVDLAARVTRGWSILTGGPPR